jgi:hypothetical protein
LKAQDQATALRSKRNQRPPAFVVPSMKRITATVKELVAEVIGDGNMFDKARQEKAIAGGGAPLPKSNMKNEVQDGGRTGIGLNSSPHAEPEPAGQGMIPPPSLRPMKDFNPAEPAVLHDAVNDCIVTWDWERADDFRKNAVYDAEGRVAWHGHIFDGWSNVLGG